MRKITLIIALFSVINIFAEDYVYHDLSQFPVCGTIVPEDVHPYKRLPDSIEGQVRKELYDLGKNTAGMYIRFSSDTKALRFKWNSVFNLEMNHMTPAGIRGLDLYTLNEDGEWEWVNAARPVINKKSCTSTVMTNMKRKMRDYMLFLPLYDGVDSLRIGIDPCATLDYAKSNLPLRDKPIVAYGTSILQGGCANRAGTCHINMLVRMLNREFYNFGFSGNGRLDVEIAELMATIDAGMYIIDCLPNVTAAVLKEKMEPFFRILREKRPNVPILFVESPIFPGMRFNNEEYRLITEKNETLKEIFKNYKKQGEKRIYYMKGDKILGGEVEGTVDGYHLTDVGFRIFAKNIYPIIKRYAIAPEK